MKQNTNPKLLKNTDPEIPLIISKETEAFLQIKTDFDTEVLVHKKTLAQ